MDIILALDKQDGTDSVSLQEATDREDLEEKE